MALYQYAFNSIRNYILLHFVKDWTLMKRIYMYIYTEYFVMHLQICCRLITSVSSNYKMTLLSSHHLPPKGLKLLPQKLKQSPKNQKQTKPRKGESTVNP